VRTTPHLAKTLELELGRFWNGESKQTNIRCKPWQGEIRIKTALTELVMTGEVLKLKLIPKSQRNPVSKQCAQEKYLQWPLYCLSNVIQET